MRIKTLEVQGFKSFVDRTVVHFEEGVTGVVGPNGCGKSNIVDAIRWVMGEQSAKHLRGGAMEDVIFNGCESRAPMGMAQVFLTFDNSDGRAPAEYAAYSEIQIGRRLYRSGESEYFINKTPCRLKDIVDIFLGTGVGTKAYSIIEQGRVDQIVSAKPEDRRMLIEEAAGISKFKVRRESALRKMESTRTNLARLDDILAELGRQINSLNRQAKKAERFKKIDEELRVREMILSATKYRELSSRLSDLEAKKVSMREQEVALSSQLSQYETELDSRRIEISETERELDGVQQQLYSVQNAIKLAETKIAHKKQERNSLSQQNDELAGEIEELKNKASSLDEAIGRANEEKVRADLALAGSEDVVREIDESVNAVRAEHKSYAQASEDDKLSLARVQSGSSHERSRVEDLERRAIDLRGRIARNQSEIDGIDARINSIKNDLGKLSGELDGMRQMRLSIQSEYDSTVATLAQQREALRQAETRLQALREEYGAKKSRLNSLKELRDNFEGYREGVKTVLKRSREAQEELKGIVGTVGDLVETEPHYERALSAVLGERLQGVVVRSHEEGVGAIDYLKAQSSGRSTFIPMNVRLKASSGEETLQGEGVIGPMTNVVRFSDDYRAIGHYLMGDVVLVDNLTRALGLWRDRPTTKTFVTLDGEVVDPAGVVTGGAGGEAEERFVVQKRQIQELGDELNILSSELTRAEGEVIQFSEHVKSLEASVENLARTNHGEEIRIVSQERDVARLSDELARYGHERDRMSVEIAALTQELNEVEWFKGEATARIEGFASEENAIRERLAASEGRLNELSARLSNEESRLLECRINLAQASEKDASITRELEGLVHTVTEARMTKGRRLAEINRNNEIQNSLARDIESLSKELDLGISSIDGLEQSRCTLSEKYNTLTEHVRSRELEIRELRKNYQTTSGEAHAVDIEYTEQRGKVDHLVSNMRDRYHIDIEHAHGEYSTPEDFEVAAEEAHVADLRDRLEKIGAVNVDAIAEFEELSTRYDFLNRQREDLAASLDNLQKAIARINRTSRQRFKSTFDAVDAEFQKAFPRLFRGGRARLMLTDEDNLLETGVEIVAQPPGKKLQSITLLSGGEKALTAVALIFSIFLIKPSPFCLLDEVDAPLDDANIDRFNDLIRSMIEHSQFILITHNKRTMELADLLYGVTMEEAGASKIVSVRLNQGQVEPAVA